MSTTRPTFAEAEFRKANRSEPNRECVCVARQDGWVELRDDKKAFGAPDDNRLVFTAEEFDSYLTAVRAGDTEGLILEIARSEDDTTYRFRRSDWAGIELEFTEAEVLAFHDGVAKHEFDAIAYAV